MSNIWLDKKYCSLIGIYLERFKVVNNNPYNARFRCPYCGDSKTNLFKTRGYLYEHDGGVIFKCHNCDHSTSLNNFLKDQSQELYQEYKLESIKDNKKDKLADLTDDDKFTSDMSKFSKKKIDKFDKFKPLKKVSSLDNNHPAKKYIMDRKIPTNKHYLIYYVDAFYKWVNTIIPDKFTPEQLEKDAPRIVFPFISQDGFVFGAQGRVLDKSEPRYISVVWDDAYDKMFGMERADLSTNVIAVEGPIDSLFLSNGVAFAGSNGTLCSPEIFTIVLDNEPRNKEIVRTIDKYIKSGYRVCIWPDNINQKDINDMILSGIDISTIERIIYENTYRGLAAKMKLTEWKKT